MTFIEKMLNTYTIGDTVHSAEASGTVRAFAIERGRIGVRVEVAARVRWWFVELDDVLGVESAAIAA